MRHHLAADEESQFSLCGKDAFPAVLVDRMGDNWVETDFCKQCMNVYASVGRILVSASIRVRLKEQTRRT